MGRERNQRTPPPSEESASGDREVSFSNMSEHEILQKVQDIDNRCEVRLAQNKRELGEIIWLGVTE